MDVERTIEFILQQQARFSEQLNQTAALLERVVTVQEGFATGQAELRAEVTALTAEVRQLTADVKQLTESQQHTDERVNVLIGVVDELRRNRRQ